jgi:hypothetical protein
LSSPGYDEKVSFLPGWVTCGLLDTPKREAFMHGVAKDGFLAAFLIALKKTAYVVEAIDIFA